MAEDEDVRLEAERLVDFSRRLVERRLRQQREKQQLEGFRLPPMETIKSDISFDGKVWRRDTIRDEASISRRRWVVPGYGMRGTVTVLAGAPGAGKSLSVVCMAIALILGKPWSRFRPLQPCRVMVYNTEDDAEEQERRFSAGLKQFGAKPADLAGRLLLNGPDRVGTLLERDPATGKLVPPEAMIALGHEIALFRPDVLFLDPLVELHNCEENDNTALRGVVAYFRSLALGFDMLVVLVHHARKGSAADAGDADMIRGAGAIVGAARVALTLSVMTEDEAAQFSVAKDMRRQFLRLDGAKSNYAEVHAADWFRLTQYQLANGTETEPGDVVAAPVPWMPPTVWKQFDDDACNRALDRVVAGFRPGEPFTASKRGHGNVRWIGFMLMDELALTEEQALLVSNTWLRNGLVYEEEYRDKREGKTRTGLFVDASKRPAPARAEV